MSKFWDDILKENGGYSAKRVLLLIFTFNALIISVSVTWSILFSKEIPEAATFIFAEILTFILALVGATVWAKHDKFQNPNTEEDSP